MAAENEYQYFTVHQLAPGVFATCGTEGGGALNNAGIVDLGDQTVVFDTFAIHPAKQELKWA